MDVRHSLKTNWQTWPFGTIDDIADFARKCRQILDDAAQEWDLTARTRLVFTLTYEDREYTFTEPNQIPKLPNVESLERVSWSGTIGPEEFGPDDDLDLHGWCYRYYGRTEGTLFAEGEDRELVARVRDRIKAALDELIETNAPLGPVDRQTRGRLQSIGMNPWVVTTGGGLMVAAVMGIFFRF